MALLSILTSEEIQSLYSIPTFDEEERSFFFALDEGDRAYLQTLNNDIPRMVNYILQLGFYQAVNYLFQFSFQSQQANIEFILKQYFPGAPFPKKNLPKKYHYQNRRQVMKKYGFSDANSDFKAQLLKVGKSVGQTPRTITIYTTGIVSLLPG